MAVATKKQTIAQRVTAYLKRRVKPATINEMVCSKALRDISVDSLRRTLNYMANDSTVQKMVTKCKIDKKDRVGYSLA